MDPNSNRSLVRTNTSLARVRWNLAGDAARALKDLTSLYRLSVRLGDVLLLNGNWYVTHTGLLRIALRRHCSGISVEAVKDFCDSMNNRWIFQAIVYARNGHAFYGYGDADPSNVSPVVRGAEMRVAETRAVNRALRKAYGVGLCSVEELGSNSGLDFSPPAKSSVSPKIVSINGHGKVLLRDQLNQLVNEYELDAEQVKRYAAHFCGTQHVREASRELVQDFIQQLTSEASTDRKVLMDKLSRYSQTLELTEEARPDGQADQQEEEVRS